MTEKQKKFESPDQDTSLEEIQELVDKINQLTALVKEIDSMPLIAKINKLPF